MKSPPNNGELESPFYYNEECAITLLEEFAGQDTFTVEQVQYVRDKFNDDNQYYCGELYDCDITGGQNGNSDDCVSPWDNRPEDDSPSGASIFQDTDSNIYTCASLPCDNTFTIKDVLHGRSNSSVK